jgi:hypothetical protein
VNGYAVKVDKTCSASRKYFESRDTMVRRSALLVLVLIGIFTICYSSIRTSGQEQLPAPQSLFDRETKLEFELARLTNMAAGMGENHPQLNMVKKKISELQAELVALARGAGPFGEALAADKADVDKLLRQMTDQEVRQAVLHLFGQVKDLQRRLDRIEGKGA